VNHDELSKINTILIFTLQTKKKLFYSHFVGLFWLADGFPKVFKQHTECWSCTFTRSLPFL